MLYDNMNLRAYKYRPLAKIFLSDLIMFFFTLYTSILFYLRGVESTTYLKIVFIFLITLLGSYLIRGIRKIQISTFQILILLFYMYVFIGCIYNKKLEYLAQFTLALIFMFIGTNLHIWRFRSGINIMKSFSVIYALACILQYFHPNFFIKNIFTLYDEEISIQLYENFIKIGAHAGLTSQVGHTAGYISVGIGLLASPWILKLPNKKVLNMGILSVLVYGLLLTSKRGHLLFTVTTISLVYLLVNAKNRKECVKVAGKLILVYLVGGSIIALFLNRSNSTKAIARSLGFFSDLFSDADITSGRRKLYARAWSLFLRHPVVGVGWGQFRETYSVGLLRANEAYYVHNVYLQLLCETGILGFLLFIAMASYCLMSTYKKLRLNIDNKGDYFFCTLLIHSLYLQIFFLLYCITGNPLYNPNYLFMYFFGLAIGGSIIPNNKISDRIIKEKSGGMYHA